MPYLMSDWWDYISMEMAVTLKQLQPTNRQPKCDRAVPLGTPASTSLLAVFVTEVMEASHTITREEVLTVLEIMWIVIPKQDYSHNVYLLLAIIIIFVTHSELVCSLFLCLHSM